MRHFPISLHAVGKPDEREQTQRIEDYINRYVEQRAHPNWHYCKILYGEIADDLYLTEKQVCRVLSGAGGGNTGITLANPAYKEMSAE